MVNEKSSQSSKQTAPSGQGLIEFLVIFLAIGLVLTGFSAVISLANGRLELIETTRFIGDRCRVHQASCSQLEQSVGLFLSQSGAQSEPVLSSIEQPSGGSSREIRPTFDQPFADVSGQAGLGGLYLDSLGYLLELGGDLFGLPDSRRLSRVSTRRDLSLPWGEFSQEERLASLSDSWTAQTRDQAVERIQKGTKPVGMAEDLARLGQAPAIDILLPTFDFLGLESQSNGFQTSFKRVDPMSPYPHLNP